MELTPLAKILLVSMGGAGLVILLNAVLVTWEARKRPSPCEKHPDLDDYLIFGAGVVVIEVHDWIDRDGDRVCRRPGCCAIEKKAGRFTSNTKERPKTPRPPPPMGQGIPSGRASEWETQLKKLGAVLRVGETRKHEHDWLDIGYGDRMCRSPGCDAAEHGVYGN